MRTGGGNVELLRFNFPTKLQVEPGRRHAGVAPELSRGGGISKQVRLKKLQQGAAGAAAAHLRRSRHPAKLPRRRLVPLVQMQSSAADDAVGDGGVMAAGRQLIAVEDRFGA